jgi:hypothetical protein
MTAYTPTPGKNKGRDVKRDPATIRNAWTGESAVLQ